MNEHHGRTRRSFTPVQSPFSFMPVQAPAIGSGDRVTVLRCRCRRSTRPSRSRAARRTGVTRRSTRTSTNTTPGRPQLRSFEQHSAHATALIRRIDVELGDASVIDDQHPDDRPLHLGYPDRLRRKDLLDEPALHVVLAVSRRRDRWEGSPSGGEPDGADDVCFAEPRPTYQQIQWHLISVTCG